MTARKVTTPKGEGLVTVTPVHPFQVGYAGVVVGPGESIDVPAEVAAQWIASGLAG